MKSKNLFLLIVGFLIPIILRKGRSKDANTSVPNKDTPSTSVPSFCQLNPSNDAFTTNFKLSEFASRDGITVPTAIRGNVQELMNRLEIVRAACGNRRIIITSGYRTVERNDTVGGKNESLHLCGKAVDFRVEGLTILAVAATMARLIKEKKLPDGGFAYSTTQNFIHYDTGKARRWTY